MTAHHSVGVDLATLAASNSGSRELRDLGRLMVANQIGEIAIMQRWWPSCSSKRSLRNFDHAHLPGALNAPPDRVKELATLIPSKQTEIVTY